MSGKCKAILFEINKNTKVGILANTYIWGEKAKTGKNIKVDDYSNDLGVVYVELKKGATNFSIIKINNLSRVSKTSKLGKGKYYVSENGHYIFSKQDDGKIIEIRYQEKEKSVASVFACGKIFRPDDIDFSKIGYRAGLNPQFNDEGYNVNINIAYTPEGIVPNFDEDEEVNKADFSIRVGSSEEFKKLQEIWKKDTFEKIDNLFKEVPKRKKFTFGFILDNSRDKEEQLEEAIEHYREEHEIYNQAVNDIDDLICKLHKDLHKIRVDKVDELKKEINENVERVLMSAYLKENIGVLLNSSVMFEPFFKEAKKIIDECNEGLSEENSFKLIYNKKDNVIKLDNSKIFLFSAENPERMRGFNLDDFFINNTIFKYKGMIRYPEIDKDFILSLACFTLYRSPHLPKQLRLV